MPLNRPISTFRNLINLVAATEPDKDAQDLEQPLRGKIVVLQQGATQTVGLYDAKQAIEDTVIDPWKSFRGLTNALNQTHIISANAFAQSMGGLLTGSDGATAMQGPGSVALANLIGNYLTAAQQLTGSDPSHPILCSRLEDAAKLCEQFASDLQQTLDSITVNQPNGAAQALGGVAIGLDIGAGAQGGLDVPWDVVAGGVTLLALAVNAATSNSEDAAVQQAISAKDIAVDVWNSQMENGPNTEPLPQLPPDPLGPKGDGASFLKALGIATVVAVSLGALGALIWNDIKGNASQRQDALNKLKQEFPECDDAFLEKFLEDHPDVPLDQIQRALELMRLQAQYQAMLNQIDALHDPRLAKIRNDIATNLKTLNRVNPFTVTDDQLDGLRNNLNSANAELALTLQYINTGQLTGSQQNVNYVGKNGPTYISVDDVISTTDSNGNPITKWIEVKNIKPFTTGSSTWTNPKTGVQVVVERYIQAAQQNGIKNIEFDFPKGVTDSVKQAIEEMGKNAGMNITVKTPSVPPPVDPGNGWCTS